MVAHLSPYKRHQHLVYQTTSSGFQRQLAPEFFAFAVTGRGAFLGPRGLRHCPSRSILGPDYRIVAFSCEDAEQWIKQGRGAIKRTRPRCRTFAADAIRVQLHALAYNFGNFMRTLGCLKTAAPWSLTSLREKLIKIGAKFVSHGR